MSEMLNILTRYAEEMYGVEGQEDRVVDGEEKKGAVDDISRTLENELAELKRTRERGRFQMVCSLTRNVVFIQCSEEINPVDLTYKILTDIQTKGDLIVRYAQRLLPVSLVCRASIDDIKRTAPSLLERHFHGTKSKSMSYAVAYKARNNSELKRDEVISVVAALVDGDGSFGHKVNLTSPELVVVVEVVKKHCLMSVVRDYHNLKKYNMHSIVEEKTEKKEEKASK
ncbi:THUMP domain-containing protein 1-like isoform X2 [Corticium candelabrum]|nr:THUMP domain-containing protein 1-like isoform X2 [Corticium candelabrum]